MWLGWLTVKSHPLRHPTHSGSQLMGWLPLLLAGGVGALIFGQEIQKVKALTTYRALRLCFGPFQAPSFHQQVVKLVAGQRRAEEVALYKVAVLSRRKLSWPLVSTPSAMAFKLRLCVMDMMEIATATASELSGRSSTKDLSIFTESMATASNRKEMSSRCRNHPGRF